MVVKNERHSKAKDENRAYDDLADEHNKLLGRREKEKADALNDKIMNDKLWRDKQLRDMRKKKKAEEKDTLK